MKNRAQTFVGILFIASALFFNFIDVHADTGPTNWNVVGHNADWMFEGKVGLSTHYFAHNKDELQKVVGQFRSQDVADQAARAGASWFLFSMHHTPWVMMAPNATYDKILGVSGYSSNRDVPLELSNALDGHGIRLMLYVNLRLDPDSACPEEVRDAMGGWPPNDRLIENVAAVYREFSVRYGSRVSGWYLDGAGFPAYVRAAQREKWFRQIAAALRAGNPSAIVAFSPGLHIARYSVENDYIAGENNDIGPIPQGRGLNGVQWHLWTFLGNTWGSGGTRFENGELLDYARRVTENGGVLTFDVGTIGRVRSSPGDRGVLSPSNVGRIDPEQVEQVRFVTQGIRSKSKVPFVNFPRQMMLAETGYMIPGTGETLLCCRLNNGQRALLDLGN